MPFTRPTRPARPSPRGAPRRHVRPPPPANHRRRRGPKPPPGPWVDILFAKEPQERRHLLLAGVVLGLLALRARRGVQQALGATVEVPPGVPPAPVGWGAATLAAMATAATTAGARQALDEAILAAFAHYVRAYAEAAGADAYIWTSRHDDLVRDLHVELDGTEHTWDNPPLAGEPDFFGHPGEAAGPCRCSAFPVIRNTAEK